MYYKGQVLCRDVVPIMWLNCLREIVDTILDTMFTDLWTCNEYSLRLRVHNKSVQVWDGLVKDRELLRWFLVMKV